jgi:LPXTG-site transpeptidase (sortase) family protein
MTSNPLIPGHTDSNDGPMQDPSASASVNPVLQPVDNTVPDKKDPAVDMIRQKLEAIYAEEPETKKEIAEVKALEAQAPRSKHQQFMLNLSSSGKGLAEIQTEWHQYYLGLSDQEKREVWQEFYSNSPNAQHGQHGQHAQHPQHTPHAQHKPLPSVSPITDRSHPDYLKQIYPHVPETEQDSRTHHSNHHNHSNNHTPKSDNQPPASPVTSQTQTVEQDSREPAAIRQQLRERVQSRGKLKVKHHLQSLLFGLGFGGLVLLVVLFSFFNEVVVAPFIQPSRTVSATPIIVSADGVAPTDKSEVIIPKINLEIPLDFSAKTINEKEIENGLDNGVVHYPTTALPGQQGNAAFFGHSSNNIFNPGKYKFAFVLLHELVPGDTFYLTHKGVAYAYQVYDTKVVEPTDVSVLNPVEGKKATAVLITCDPPGTSLHRLVVWGEQTSPNPAGNVVPPPTPTTSGAEQALPGNGPTLWRRLLNAVTGH